MADPSWCSRKKKQFFIAETIIGHTIQVPIASNKKEISCFRVSVRNINEQLKKFWNLESIGIEEKMGTFLVIMK